MKRGKLKVKQMGMITLPHDLELGYYEKRQLVARSYSRVHSSWDVFEIKYMYPANSDVKSIPPVMTVNIYYEKFKINLN